MLLSKRLIQIIGWLPILALAYGVAGLPLIHPFFHHPYEKRRHLAGRHDLNRAFSNDERPLKELQRHSNCRICSFLQGFHGNHPATFSIEGFEQFPWKINLPLDASLIKRFEHWNLLPRPPPTPMA